ncbi:MULTISPECIES: PA2169 family four-helix-bundle protein [Dyella]|uniref:PA2169 family four-helix-bundle protein n=2 Tax=Dyella TaxID=231454 RepID=A0A4V2NML9_9GAMM|nr:MULTISPECIES: PA2169 family four-helix-bundle protein [Dyella]TBR39779.1 PA2169 family four-helix-bundle protein [Dyella terrae]TCI13807.1 PA2169 family four-helix-bundle protein [Dyella soli]
MTQDHDIKVLNDLIETTIDSADGYKEAAKDANNEAFKDIFMRRAKERVEITHRLQSAVRQAGGKPQDDGTVLAGAHRMFTNLRASMTKGDTAVVDEVERGEDHIKARFEKAINDNDLSTVTRSAIEQAYGPIRSGHDEMSKLKHALHASRH